MHTFKQVSEAEALVAGGITDVLLSNQVVAPAKLARLAALAAGGAQLWGAIGCQLYRMLLHTSIRTEPCTQPPLSHTHKHAQVPKSDCVWTTQVP